MFKVVPPETELEDFATELDERTATLLEDFVELLDNFTEPLERSTTALDELFDTAPVPMFNVSVYSFPSTVNLSFTLPSWK